MDRAAGELRALTGLRGVAAWTVVLFHLRLSLGLPAPLLAAAGHLNLAVDLFFALSGFVIWHAWHARLAEGAPGTAAAFLLRRLARVWPLHAAVLGTLALLALALQASGRAHTDLPWAALPAHLALVQGWGITDRLGWNDPDWSVSCEWGAYLLTPLLVTALDWREVRTGLLVALLAAIPFALADALHAQGADAIGAGLPATGLARCLPDYLAGTILAELWRRLHAAPGAWPATLAVAGLLAVAAPLLPPIVAADALVLAILAAVALGCGHPALLLDRAFAVTLGRWSYATYLVHYPLWTVWKLLFVADVMHPGAGVLAGYAAAVLATSALAHRWIERPAYAAAGARIDGWRQRRAARTADGGACRTRRAC